MATLQETVNPIGAAISKATRPAAKPMDTQVPFRPGFVPAKPDVQQAQSVPDDFDDEMQAKLEEIKAKGIPHDDAIAIVGELKRRGYVSASKPEAKQAPAGSERTPFGANIIAGAVAGAPKAAASTLGFASKLGSYVNPMTYVRGDREEENRRIQQILAQEAERQAAPITSRFDTESAGFKVGEFIPQAGIAGVGVGGAKAALGAIPKVAETVASVSKAAPSLSRIGLGAAEGAAYGATVPVLEKGAEATSGEIAKSAAIGGALGGAIPAIGQGISRSGQALTQAIPKKLVENSLKLTPTERKNVERITGLSPAEWLLNRNLAAKGKEDIAQNLASKADELYTGITEKLVKLPKSASVQSAEAKNALGAIVKNLEASDLLKARYADDIKYLSEMAKRSKFSPAELNAIRRTFDKVVDNVYTSQGGIRTGMEKEALAEIRRGLNDDLQKAAEKYGIDVRNMNEELRASITIKDGLLRAMSQEEKNNFIGLQDLGLGAILSAGNPATAVAGIAAKKYLESQAPSISQTLFNIGAKKYVPSTLTRGGPVPSGGKPVGTGLIGRYFPNVAPVGGKVAGKSQKISKSEPIKTSGKSPTKPLGTISDDKVAEISKKSKRPSTLELTKSNKGFINPRKIGEDIGLIKEMPKNIESNTESMAKAIRSYTKDNSVINRYLREGKEHKNVKEIDAFIKSAEKNNGIVYRGITIPETKYESILESIRKNGLSDNAYLSSTRNIGDATTFARTSASNKTKGLIFEIDGKNGAIVPENLNAFNEEEVIFPRGTKFEYAGEYKDAGRGLVMRLKEKHID